MRISVTALMAISVLGGCGNGTHAANDAPPANDAPLAIDASFLDSSSWDAPPDASPGYAVARSGSRLKLSWLQTSDGVRWPIDGFYDAMFGVDCTPSPWTDSTTRCTPQTSDALASFEYTDASCTTPFFALGSAVPANTYFAVYTQTPGSCGRVTTDIVYAVGAEIMPAATYKLNGTDCIHQTDFNHHFYTPVAMPASVFEEVSANYSSTGRISQLHWDGVDGMGWYRPLGFDTTLNAPCTYQQELDQLDGTIGICDPRGGTTTGWSDSSCMTPFVDLPIGCAPPAFVGANTVCSYTYDHRVFPVGAAFSPTTVFTGQSCTPSNINVQSQYYETSTMSVGTVATMTVTRDTSATTRLQPIYYDTTDGLHYETGAFYDTTLAVDCGIGNTGSAGVCIPTGSPTTVLYTDATCTVPFDAVQVNDDPATYCPMSLPAQVPDFGFKQLGVGFAQREYHRIAAQHIGTVYEDNTGTCRRYPEIGIPQSWRIFEVSPTVTPESAFETATIVVDP